MDAAAVRQALSNAQNPDATTRNAAEELLKQSFATDPANHLFLLSQELADESSPSTQTRMLAGLSLKNFMTSKDHAQAIKLANDWMSLNGELRGKIKMNSCASLGSLHREVQLAAAQVISKIATIELPKTDANGASQWDELIPLLLQSVVEPQQTPQGMAMKQASLHTIGYICEEIAALETNCLASKSNDILTAVVAGMRTDEQDLGVKLAATQALCNALEFAEKNFEVDTERNYIMTVIFQACGTGNDEVKEHAFQCLCKIAELYYDKITDHMQVLFEVTLNAINTQTDAVARQAIAFWSALCDTEFEMLPEYDMGKEGESQCKNYIKGAKEYLVPVLLKTMTCQEEGQDEDSYNKSTEAAACLAAIANTIQDDVMPLVMPWIEQNISQANWHLKEAAVMAFGCVMDGPSEAQLQQYVPPVLSVLITYLNDSEDLVKNSSAWAIMRITEFAPKAVQTNLMVPLCEKLMEAIPNCEASTATHLCWAIHNIANYVSSNMDDNRLPTVLSSIFMHLVQCLYSTGDRQDAGDANLRSTAYEALNVVISGADTVIIQNFVGTQLLPMFGERLNATFSMACLNADDLNSRSEWQSMFCSVLQTCINLMPAQNLLQADESGMTIADKFMHLFLQVFSSQNTTAAQEALLAVGSVCNALPDRGFDRYMPSLCPMLVGLIAASNEPALCMLAVTTTSDIARELDSDIAKYSDPIVEVLLTVLSRPEVDAQISQVHDYIKPGIYSCFGDIAMALGAGMEKYLEYWFQALQQGVQIAGTMMKKLMAEKDGYAYDEDQRIYINALCEGVFDGYVGILQGLKAASKTMPAAKDAFITSVALEGGCCTLIQIVASMIPANGDGDDENLEGVVVKALGLIGDLADIYGDKIKPTLQNQAVMEVMNFGKKCDDGEIKELVERAEKTMG